MTIFLSSTCYDLTDLRAEVGKFLIEKGHTLLLSDRNNFPVEMGKHRHDVCIDNVGKCDLFILVIDSRYGADYYKEPSISITWAEFREAIRTKRQAIALVRREVFNERQTCRKNQKLKNPFVPFYADNIKIFDIIDEIQKNENGIWMQPFDNSIDVKETLENIYATKHSPLNVNKSKLEISTNEITLTSLSGSSASFITTNFELEGKKELSPEILKSAIDKIPENVTGYEKILGSEQIPDYSNDFYYFFPLRSSDTDEEIVVSPTVLGRSVRNELIGALKKIDENNAVSFFIDTIKRKPILCRYCKYGNKSFIVGFYEKNTQYLGRIQNICVLNLFADKWQVYFEQALDEFECYPEISENTEIIIHDENIYFYFERLVQHLGTANNNLGIAEFSIFNFERKTISKLLYNGKFREGGLEGDFDFSLIEKNPDSKIYKFILEQEASKSKYIYRTPKDYNIDDPKNYIEKWNVENPDFYNNEFGSVNFFFYDENIFWGVEDYGTVESFNASSKHIENDNYIIKFLFWRANFSDEKRRS